MRRFPFLAVAAAVALGATTAAAAPAAPTPAGPTTQQLQQQLAAQQQLLWLLYQTQLAASSPAPNAQQLARITSEYFTDGAALTTVPSSGPGAAWFHDGAAATSMPAPTEPLAP